ncbi:MAG: site-2 protease family protein [Spirochaetia bacterium]|nr:site-2 protease family protein [Spirochaetia bacterium]
MKKMIKELKIYFKETPFNTLRNHILLFIVTFFSATFTQYALINEENEIKKILLSLSYSVPVMIILFSHEMGHYLFARRNNVEVTLPYFIPFPFLNQIGTLGAYIRMRTLPPDRASLFDIAFWGPAMSFLLSIPVTIIGLLLAENSPVVSESAEFHFGTPYIIDILAKLFTNFSETDYLVSHPMVFAGWVGFLVTAINLFPIGQLDGGHIAYAFFGKRQKNVSFLFMVIIFILSFEFAGWLFFAAMIYIMVGLRHPPIYEHHIEKLNLKRKKMALLSVLMLTLCFMPVPIYIHDEAIRPRTPVPHHIDDEFRVENNTDLPKDKVYRVF